MGRAFVAGLHLLFFRYLSLPGASNLPAGDEGAMDRDRTTDWGDTPDDNGLSVHSVGELKENDFGAAGYIGTRLGLGDIVVDPPTSD